jgi:hypothetical protein
MRKFINPFFLGIRNFLVVSLLFIASCDEGPQELSTDGYYIVDGKRYNVQFISVHAEPSPPGRADNNTKLIFHGDGDENISVYLTVSAGVLEATTYQVWWGYVMLGAYRPSVTTEPISKDFNSVGTLLIGVDGKKNVIDLEANIEGHSVQAHYVGLALYDQ